MSLMITWFVALFWMFIYSNKGSSLVLLVIVFGHKIFFMSMPTFISPAANLEANLTCDIRLIGWFSSYISASTPSSWAVVISLFSRVLPCPWFGFWPLPRSFLLAFIAHLLCFRATFASKQLVLQQWLVVQVLLHNLEGLSRVLQTRCLEALKLSLPPQTHSFCEVYNGMVIKIFI